jgi:hypothetical protein
MVEIKRRTQSQTTSFRNVQTKTKRPEAGADQKIAVGRS